MDSSYFSKPFLNVDVFAVENLVKQAAAVMSGHFIIVENLLDSD